MLLIVNTSRMQLRNKASSMTYKVVVAMIQQSNETKVSCSCLESMPFQRCDLHRCSNPEKETLHSDPKTVWFYCKISWVKSLFKNWKTGGRCNIYAIPKATCFHNTQHQFLEQSIPKALYVTLKTTARLYTGDFVIKTKLNIFETLRSNKHYLLQNT